MDGTVKWYNRKKGFGFVTGEDGQEYFVHYTALQEANFLRDNDKVSFEPADTDKGKQAQNVRLLQKASEMEGAAPAKRRSDAEDEDAEYSEDDDYSQEDDNEE